MKPAKPSSERGNGDKPAARPTPVAAIIDGDPWARASQVALIGLFVIALVWCAYVARPVIVPVVLAWVIATLALPMVAWLQKRGLPRAVSAIGVTLGLLLLIAGLLALLSSPIAQWIGRASELGALIKQKLETMDRPFAFIEELRKAVGSIELGGDAPALKVEQSNDTVIATVFSILTPAVSQFILFIGALAFYLVYQTRLRSTIATVFTSREARLAALHTMTDIDDSMSAYFGTFTLVNLCLGTITALIAWAVGLPNPVLWGVLAGVLNYVPYLGPAIVAATLALVGLVTYPTISEAAIAPILFVSVVTVEGHFITPTLMGRRLELNPFAVFLAIAFCTWLWGPIGAFLAVPLLMALTVTLGHMVAEEKPELPE